MQSMLRYCIISIFSFTGIAVLGALWNTIEQACLIKNFFMDITQKNWNLEPAGKCYQQYIIITTWKFSKNQWAYIIMYLVVTFLSYRPQYWAWIPRSIITRHFLPPF